MLTNKGVEHERPTKWNTQDLTKDPTSQYQNSGDVAQQYRKNNFNNITNNDTELQSHGSPINASNLFNSYHTYKITQKSSTTSSVSEISPLQQSESSSRVSVIYKSANENGIFKDSSVGITKGNDELERIGRMLSEQRNNNAQALKADSSDFPTAKTSRPEERSGKNTLKTDDHPQILLTPQFYKNLPAGKSIYHKYHHYSFQEPDQGMQASTSHFLNQGMGSPEPDLEKTSLKPIFGNVPTKVTNSDNVNAFRKTPSVQMCSISVQRPSSNSENYRLLKIQTSNTPSNNPQDSLLIRSKLTEAKETLLMRLKEISDFEQKLNNKCEGQKPETKVPQGISSGPRTEFFPAESETSVRLAAAQISLQQSCNSQGPSKTTYLKERYRDDISQSVTHSQKQMINSLDESQQLTRKPLHLKNKDNECVRKNQKDQVPKPLKQTELPAKVETNEKDNGIKQDETLIETKNYSDSSEHKSHSLTVGTEIAKDISTKRDQPYQLTQESLLNSCKARQNMVFAINEDERLFIFTKDEVEVVKKASSKSSKSPTRNPHLGGNTEPLVEERNLAWLHYKNAKINNLQIEMEKKELENCTFKPQILSQRSPKSLLSPQAKTQQEKGLTKLARVTPKNSQPHSEMKKPTNSYSQNYLSQNGNKFLTSPKCNEMHLLKSNKENNPQLTFNTISSYSKSQVSKH